jgi:hypothetical protein
VACRGRRGGVFRQKAHEVPIYARVRSSQLASHQQMDRREAWKETVRELCFGNDSSDEEDNLFLATVSALHESEASQRGPWGGSVPGCRRIERNRLEGHHRLFNDYFADHPVYPDYIFRRR